MPFCYEKDVTKLYSLKFHLNGNNFYTSIKINDNTFYIIPRYINCNKWSTDFDAFDEFLTELNPSSFCIVGDLNAHTGRSYDMDEHLLQNFTHISHIRNSKHKSIDSRGRKLIELFDNMGGIILNGRHVGDSEGAFTFYGGVGQTVVDYCVCSFDLLSFVSRFVIPVKEFSDHMPLEVTFTAPASHFTESSDLPAKLKWRDSFKDSYINNLLRNSHSDYILSEEPIDQKVDTLISKVRNAAPVSQRKKSFSPKNAWFDDQCYTARCKMLRQLNLLRKFNLDVHKRQYLICKRNYIGICKNKKTKHQLNTIKSLCTVKNASDWWRIANSYKNPALKVSCSLSANDFAMHFNSLLSVDSNCRLISWCIPSVIDPYLDAPFELDELLVVLNNCKNNKAPGLDRISFEFYKNAPLSFALEVLRLLNYIFLAEDIPSAFRKAIIVPLHKKGDPNDASNYRGLSLLDTLYKIFTGLILNRLKTWVELNEIINEFQAGFRRNYSTIDNIFNLNAIVHLNFCNKTKTYAFFVDFKCAFDKLPRNSLFYKLSMLGLSKKMIVIIMLLYSETTSYVWSGSDMSEPIHVEQGVKQGCLLSPLLFSLYVNDLHDSLPGGVQIGNTTVKVLMYADDIVLLSTCPRQLQCMINSLATYCNTWGLKVNLNKSKIVVFREGPRLSSSLSWIFENSPIEIVNEYMYLGMLLTYNMSFRKHLETKLRTAKNAINASWSALVSNTNIDVSNKLKIFDAAAKSILLYGAQVWGYMEYDEVERLLRFFVKKILCLPKNTPNYMVNLETNIPPLFITTIRLHLDYIRKVTQLPSSRLPRILALLVFDKRIIWAQKWINLYDSYGLNFPLDLSHPNLKSQHDSLIEALSDSQLIANIERARNSTNHDLYPYLNYNMHSIVFSNVSSKILSLFLKARGGMLNLNANPFIRTYTDLCTICNLRAKEDTHHIIGIFPIFNYLRIKLFGKPQLSLAEVIALLNGHNIKALFEFLIQSLKYRNLLLNEFY